MDQTAVSALAELQRWYSAQSDGDWEHCYGIKIETLDNPGWQMSIDLAETELKDASFVEILHNEIGQRYEDNLDWFLCRKVDGKFEGIGGPEQLEAILRVFLDWVHSAAGAARSVTMRSTGRSTTDLLPHSLE